MNTRIKYALIPAGAYAGAPAIWLSPNGSGEATYDEILSRINRTFTTMNIHIRIVVFDTREFSFPEADLGDVTRIIDELISDEVMIIHYVSGYERPSYIRMGGIVKAFISDDDWLGFPTNELYWMPSDSEAEEPDLAEHRNVVRYVVLGKRFGVRAGMNFLTRCEKAWAVVNPPKREVEIIIDE